MSEALLSKKFPTLESEPTGVERILSVSPIKDDHVTLRRFLPRRKLTECFSLTAAVEQLAGRHRIPLVICEANLTAANWRHLLYHTIQTDPPPLLVVTSAVADEYLWAEVLNLEGFDVLAKPFDAFEVNRVVTSACLRWYQQHGLRTEAGAHRIAVA